MSIGIEKKWGDRPWRQIDGMWFRSLAGALTGILDMYARGGDAHYRLCKYKGKR